MPTLDNLVVLAAVLGVAMDDIIVTEGEWHNKAVPLLILRRIKL